MNNRQIVIKEVSNGYETKRTADVNGGDYVYRSIDAAQMLEDIGYFLLGYKIKVERR